MELTEGYGMVFVDDMLAHQKHATEQFEAITNEAATKTVLVQPFLKALGYKVDNMKEVYPEYPVEFADVKNELIDYAILQDEVPIILVECKPCNEELKKKHVAQLINYYPKIKGSKFGILTNGIKYRFFTDIEIEHLLDEEPFLELDILKMKTPDINEIEMFSKPINKDGVHERAVELKRIREIKNLIESEFKKPSKEFIKFIANKIIKEGVISPTIQKKFCIYTKEACRQFIPIEVIHEEPPELPKTKYFILDGIRHEVKFWKDMLPKVCADMAIKHKDIFSEEIFKIKGDSNLYFSRNKDELNSPESIEGTDIYVATNFPKGYLLSLARKVVSAFNHPEDYVLIEGE
jgi:hypothetical protein